MCSLLYLLMYILIYDNINAGILCNSPSGPVIAVVYSSTLRAPRQNELLYPPPHPPAGQAFGAKFCFLF